MDSWWCGRGVRPRCTGYTRVANSWRKLVARIAVEHWWYLFVADFRDVIDKRIHRMETRQVFMECIRGACNATVNLCSVVYIRGSLIVYSLCLNLILYKGTNHKGRPLKFSILNPPSGLWHTLSHFRLYPSLRRQLYCHKNFHPPPPRAFSYL